MANNGTADASDLANHPWFSGDRYRHGPGNGDTDSLLDLGAEVFIAEPSRRNPSVDDAIEDTVYGTISLSNTSAHRLLDADPLRASIAIYNLGPGIVYIGADRGVKPGGGNTTTILAGGQLNDMKGRKAMHAIADTALTVVTFVIERYGA